MLRLRNDVFVVEQRCAYPDIDGEDCRAVHLLVWLEAGGPLCGCLRLFEPGPDGRQARIGRVATARAARRVGLGRWMMLQALARIDRRFAGAVTGIDAQVEVEGFYRNLGFRRVSDGFDEDGIAHCTMLRRPRGP